MTHVRSREALNSLKKTVALIAAAVLMATMVLTLTPQNSARAAGTITDVYFHVPNNWAQANIHYRIGNGTWTNVPGKAMAAVPGTDRWAKASIETGSQSTITAAFNNGNGIWDNNNSHDYTIPAGQGPQSVNAGNVTAGVPAGAPTDPSEPTDPTNPGQGGSGGAVSGPLAGTLTLYYKQPSWTTAYAHYQIGNGAWTDVPGKAMTSVASCDAGAGWHSITISSGAASSVRVAFNNGSGTWDNNNSHDYTFTTSVAAVNNGAVTTTDPCYTSTTDPDPDPTEEPTDEPTDPSTDPGEENPGGETPAQAPAIPTGLAAGSTTSSSIPLTWNATNGATSYTIKYVTGTQELTRSTTGTSVTLTGLAASTAYTVSIRATGDGGESDFSQPITIHTIAAPGGNGGTGGTGQAGGSVAGATTGSPLGGDPREDSIYFIMTARWNDGDPSNNMGGPMHVKSGNAANNDPMFRGDFQGIVDKLDYIKGLGFSAIWITPVVTNRSDYDFHGYHGWDFQRIDPRLESPGASYQELINAAHAKGIKIYQDVVYNHTSRWGEKNLFTPTVFGTRDSQWSWYYDEPVEGKEYNPTETDADGSTYNGDLWSETQPAGQNCQNWGLQSGWSSEGYKVYNCQWPSPTSGMFPAQFFHQCWIGNWEGSDAKDCWIHEDLADLNTESEVVQDYLIDTYNKYIDMGVDGFRVDTAVHIPRVMWNRHFLPAIQEHAQAVHGEKGKDFYVFGEVAQFVHDKWNRGSVNHSAPFYTWKERHEYSMDDVVAVAEQYNYENLMGTANQPASNNHLLNGNTYHAPDHTKASGMDIIDMRMHMNFSDASTAFYAGMDSDDVTNDATYNAVYVDSHDYGPGKSQVRYDGGTDAWAENMSLMWTFRGVPVLLYGSEIEFQAGKPIDCGPTCPLATTGRAYFGDHLAGSITASDFGVVSSASGAVATTMQKPLVKHLQTLNRIRRAVPALQKGEYSRDGVSGNMAFKRRFTEGPVDSFVLVSISGGATFTGIPNGTYKDAVTGDVKTVTNGTLTISLSGKGNMRAYVLDLPGNPAPGKVGAGSSYLK